jgi:hypothetical protein
VSNFCPAIAVPMTVNMPEPMTAPMPSAVSDHGPSVFFSRCSGSSESEISLSMDLHAKSWFARWMLRGVVDWAQGIQTESDGRGQVRFTPRARKRIFITETQRHESTHRAGAELCLRQAQAGAEAPSPNPSQNARVAWIHA